jgi:hypothetical protein
MALRGVCSNFKGWSVSSGVFRGGAESPSVIHSPGSKTKLRQRHSGLQESASVEPSSPFSMRSNTNIRQRLGGRQETVSKAPRVAHSPGEQHKVAPEAPGWSRVRNRGTQSSSSALKLHRVVRKARGSSRARVIAPIRPMVLPPRRDAILALRADVHGVISQPIEEREMPRMQLRCYFYPLL